MLTMSSSTAAALSTQGTAGLALDGLPLCVDLDGTLLQVDSLHEIAVGALRRDWWSLFRIPGWLISGKALLKQRLAEAAPVDVDILPYNNELLEWLRAERARGRKVVLATASDQQTAKAVAEHLGVFESVVASDGDSNLKAEAKAERLCAIFGQGRFSYAGNDSADLAVWARAGAAVIVNASPDVARRARLLAPVEREFVRSGNHWVALAKAVRMYQWIKNLLVFAAPLAAHRMLESSTVGHVVTIFIALSLTASGIYLLNDIADLSSDRRHPRKRRRPFASGALPIAYGLILGPLLVIAGLAIAGSLRWSALLVVLSYAAVSIAYSFVLKKLPLVDVFTLAGLYTVRVVAGSIAVGTVASNWLLSASGFFFLGLAFLKRYVELTRAPEGLMAGWRRGYGAVDATVLQMMGVCSGFVACLVLAMYISSEPALRLYAQPDLLWAVVPLALFWNCRLWLSGIRGYVHDDPIVYAARDWVSWCVIASVVAIGVIATLGVGD